MSFLNYFLYYIYIYSAASLGRRVQESDRRCQAAGQVHGGPLVQGSQFRDPLRRDPRPRRPKRTGGVGGQIGLRGPVSVVGITIPESGNMLKGAMLVFSTPADRKPWTPAANVGEESSLLVRSLESMCPPIKVLRQWANRPVLETLSRSRPPTPT